MTKQEKELVKKIVERTTQGKINWRVVNIDRFEANLGSPFLLTLSKYPSLVSDNDLYEFYTLTFGYTRAGAGRISEAPRGKLDELFKIIEGNNQSGLKERKDTSIRELEKLLP